MPNLFLTTAITGGVLAMLLGALAINNAHVAERTTARIEGRTDALVKKAVTAETRVAAQPGAAERVRTKYCTDCRGTGLPGMAPNQHAGR